VSEGPGGVATRDVAGVAVASPRGEIDMSNAHAILDALAGMVPNTSRGAVVDLTGVTYLDSAGISVLFQLSNRLARRGLDLGLVVPSGSPLRRVLEVAGVGAVATLYPTLEGTIEALSAGPGGSGPSDPAGG
jgi:anti-anti-sigma factor